MFNIKKYYPLYALLTIIIITLLLYLDQRTNRFSPYIDLTLKVHWDQQTQRYEPVDIVKVSEENNIKSYHLGFIADAGQCNPAWNGNPNYTLEDAWGKTTIDKMLMHHMRLVIALGGTSGIDLSAQCDESALIKVYSHIIQTYRPDGLEFNIENATDNIPKLMRALLQIQNQYPELEIIFTLHTLPEGITIASEKILAEAKAADLRYATNLLLMNYGAAYTGNMAQYGIQATRQFYTYLGTLYPRKNKAERWAMIEITPMIGLNDVPGEVFTLADADTLNNFAKHYGIGEVSIWTANRDFPCADATATSYCSGANLEKVPYEYEGRFTK